MMISAKTICEKTARILTALVLALGMCPVALFASAGEAFAAGDLVAASVDETVIASGTYIGYGATANGALGPGYIRGSDTYSLYYSAFAPFFNWTLYESGLLALDLTGSYHIGNDSTLLQVPDSAKSPDWKSYSDEITAVEMNDVNNYVGKALSGYYYSTITNYMFSDLPNLTRFEAPGINVVAPNAFSGCAKLQDVVIGAEGQALFVCSGAFADCKKLAIVTANAQEINLGQSAFKGCDELSRLSLSAETGAIDASAFKGCTSFRTIDASMMTSIGNSAFEGCTRLRSVTLPESTTTASYLGSAAFKNCSSLESVTLPAGMTSLSASAFEGASALASVDLATSVASVGSSAFRDCALLESITNKDGLTAISSYAFSGCSSLQGFTLPEALSSIGQYAFQGSGIVNMSIPSGVTTLMQHAFDGCPALRTVSISSGVGSIGASCFADCPELSSVDVGSSVATISSAAFSGCSALTEVRFGGEAPAIASGAFEGVSASALYPIDNKYWTADDMKDYGGSLVWSPYGDLSACSLSAEDLIYSGVEQAPAVHLAAANGMEIASDLYFATCYSDEMCTAELASADLVQNGTYYVKVEGLDDKNCSGVVGPVSFQIKKAPLVISYVSEIVDKDGTPAYEIRYDGFVGDEDKSALTTLASLPTPSSLASGHSYTLTPEGAEADNYEISYESGILCVSSTRISKPACASDLIYNGKDQVAIEDGEGYALSGVSHAVSAGEYSAIIELEDGYAWSDGSLDPLTYNWSIGKAQLTAAFVDETVDAYATPALKVSVTGFVNGETAGSAAGYQAPTASVNSTMKPGYTYTATVRGGAADNYSFAYKSGKVSMSRVVIEPPEADLSSTYNGVQKTAVSAGEGYDLSGVSSATDAGSYTAIATLKDGYEWSDGTIAAKKFAWSIAPAEGSLSLAGSSLSLKIAQSDSVGFAYTGDGTVGATSSDTSVATVSIQSGKVKVEAVGEGNARIVISSSACSNYTTPASVALSVTVESIDLAQCSLSVTGGTYAGKLFDPKPVVALPEGDELAEASSHAVHYYSDSACTKEVAASALKEAGSYWARAEALAGGRSSGMTQAVAFQIEKAQLNAVYEGESIEYGSAPRACVKVTGFVGGETEATASGYSAPSVQVPSTLERATAYTLTPAGGAADNYTFAYTGGKLSVGKMVVARPVAATGLVYTGSSQTGVSPAAGCILSGTTKATDKGDYTATATLEDGCVWDDGSSVDIDIAWTIAAADIAQVSVADIADQVYSGADIQPRPELALDGLPLALGQDYSLQYSGNRNAGTADISVTGMRNFTGTKTITFKISGVDLSSAEVSGVETSYAYTGKSIAPEPVVTCKGSTLAKDVDYAVSYSNNLEAGNAALTIIGKGNYTGSVPLNFTIKKTSIADAAISGVVDKTYTGEPALQLAEVVLDGTTLAEGDDYSVSYENNTDAGIASVTFTGVGGFAGSKTLNFVIHPASIAQASIEGVEPSYVYTGSHLRPVTAVKIGTIELVEGVDYSISYSNNVSVGTASIKIDGVGNYAGSAAASFAITKASYDFSGVSFASDSVEYDGKTHFLWIDGDLPTGVKVSYEGNGASTAGDHVVTATFAGDENHEPVGSMSAVLTVHKANVSVPSAAEGLVYNGKTQKGVTPGNLYELTGASASEAGDYIATASLVDKQNCQWADGSSDDRAINWTIGKAQLIASYGGETIMYGDNPSLAVNVAGFVEGESADTAAGYAVPFVEASSSSAGTYRLIPTGGAADNYEFAYAAGNLVINKVSAIVVANPAFKVYGNDDPALSYEVIGAPASEIEQFVSIDRAPGEDVGDYAISASVSENENYKIAVLGAKLTIAKADYDMSGVYFADGSFTYDGNLHSLQIEGELPSGVSVSYAGNGKAEAGSHVVMASFAGDSNHNAIDSMTATLSIAKLRVEPPSAITEVAYTGVEQTAIASGAGYIVIGGSATEVGAHRAVVMLKDPANSTWSDGSSDLREIVWSIGKCAFNVSLSTKVTISGVVGKTFNGTAQTQNPIVRVNGRALTEGLDYTLSYRDNVNAGTAKVTVTGVGNYEGSAAATFNIAKAANPMVVKAEALKAKFKKKSKFSANKAFAIDNAQGAVSFKKILGNKKISIAKNGKITVKKGLKKGTYKIKVGVSSAGNANYSAKAVTVTVKIRVK